MTYEDKCRGIKADVWRGGELAGAWRGDPGEGGHSLTVCLVEIGIVMVAQGVDTRAGSTELRKG